MKLRSCVLISLLLGLCGAAAYGQNSGQPPTNQYSESMINISNELTNISRSVQTLNQGFKLFFEKFGTGSGTVTDKQQKIITGIQMLSAAEQRVVNFQNAQFDLTRQLNDTRSRLIQIESDLRPRNIDRSVVLEGTTETEELRETRRQRLIGERTTLTQLQRDLQNSLAETTDGLRDAQNLAARLRRTYLPQIEREMSDQ